MPHHLRRRAALATLFGAAAGLMTPPALAWHDTVGRAPRSPAPAARQPRGPQAEAQFGAVPLRETDFVLGNAEAPVTIIKYASLTCPHCATFHEATAEHLKRDHIPQGRVRYIHRNFPLDQSAMAGSMLLYCGNGGQARFFALLDILYTEQGAWTRAEDPVDALRRIAARTGINRDAFNACMSDRALADRIIAERDEGAQTYGVRATPTLLINGARYSGNLNVAQIETVLEEVA